MIPTILLVEDDSTTCAFLTAAIEALPAAVETADCVARALELARTRDHHLWLIDANLPDGDGAALLAQLRGRGLRAPALAHTAAQDRDAHAALRAAGFERVLVKPMAAVVLQAAIRSALGNPGFDDATGGAHVPGHGGAQVWDDAAALAALGGQRAHVDALRKLFLDELPAARERVREAARSGDPESLRSVLHKLRASCGFVGAVQLQAAVLALHANPDSAAALARFVKAAQEALSSV